MKDALHLVSGLLFGIGLVVSGMANPAKVRGFLDVAGAWDPSLAFVMVGAIATFATLNRLVHRRAEPLAYGSFPGPRDTLRPTVRVVLGAALFGAGWGLSGICPGPALTDLSTFRPEVLAYLAALVVGIVLAQRLFHADAPDSSTPVETVEAR